MKVFLVFLILGIPSLQAQEVDLNTGASEGARIRGQLKRVTEEVADAYQELDESLIEEKKYRLAAAVMTIRMIKRLFELHVPTTGVSTHGGEYEHIRYRKTNTTASVYPPVSELIDLIHSVLAPLQDLWDDPRLQEDHNMRILQRMREYLDIVVPDTTATFTGATPMYGVVVERGKTLQIHKEIYANGAQIPNKILYRVILNTDPVGM